MYGTCVGFRLLWNVESSKWKKIFIFSEGSIFLILSVSKSTYQSYTFPLLVKGVMRMDCGLVQKISKFNLRMAYAVLQYGRLLSVIICYAIMSFCKIMSEFLFYICPQFLFSHVTRDTAWMTSSSICWGHHLA